MLKVSMAGRNSPIVLGVSTYRLGTVGRCGGGRVHSRGAGWRSRAPGRAVCDRGGAGGDRDLGRDLNSRGHGSGGAPRVATLRVAWRTPLSWRSSDGGDERGGGECVLHFC